MLRPQRHDAPIKAEMNGTPPNGYRQHPLYEMDLMLLNH